MSEWITRVQNAWSALMGNVPNAGTPGSRAITSYEVVRPLPQTLRAYYDNNALYFQIQTAMALSDITAEAMLPIRNPAHASAEFFAATLWGDLEIIAKTQTIVDNIQTFWDWNNWESFKILMARWAAIYGDIFTKVSTYNGKVVMQLLPVETIDDSFEVDSLDNLTYIRIDTPLPMGWIFTEVWDLISYRQWKHQLGRDVAIERLGIPLVEIPLSQMGINFIPIVHGKFTDVGKRQGVGSFFHALDPIDEANRMATRLHQILFQYGHPINVITQNATDPQKRPLPPVQVGSSVDLSGDKILSLPSGADFKSTIPDIKYADALAILNAHLSYIQDEYLPELGWYHAKVAGNTSGRALRMSLTPAIARCEEARTNMDRMLQKVDAIALEIGRVNGLFSGIGAMDLGSFEHDFAKRPVIPLDGMDEALEAVQWTAAGVPVDIAVLWAGRTEEEAAKVKAGKEESLANALTQFNAGPNMDTNA